jgi:NADH dehydrogenase FAD-containing subunit
VVISPRDYFLFTTLLFGVATKSNPIRAARYPIMEYIKEAGEYIPGTCTKIGNI